MNEQYKREIEALLLLHPNWDNIPEHVQQSIHHTFLFTIDVAVEAGVVQWPTKEEPTT